MQEELERQTVALVINASKLTAQTLSDAMRRAMDIGLRELSKYKDKLERKEKEEPSGKMSLKELIGKGVTTDNMEIDKEGIKTFQKTAAKFGVDYAVYKEPLKDNQNKYYVFFQAKDTSVIHAAFNEYTTKMEQRKESVKEKMAKKEEIAKKRQAKRDEKHKEKHRSRDEIKR